MHDRCICKTLQIWTQACLSASLIKIIRLWLVITTHLTYKSIRRSALYRKPAKESLDSTNCETGSIEPFERRSRINSVCLTINLIKSLAFSRGDNSRSNHIALIWWLYSPVKSPRRQAVGSHSASQVTGSHLVRFRALSPPAKRICLKDIDLELDFEFDSIWNSDV